MPNADIPARHTLFDEYGISAPESEKVEAQREILHEWSIYGPALTKVSLGADYLWEKRDGGWVRIDTVYEHDDHELRDFDY
ncbi:hypothetical protein BDW22DRAFT_1358098 [Trametopsis cervina]|nr:hypothetical protein BDW22DRAFT_1358098 [Trametopsis cervina]